MELRMNSLSALEDEIHVENAYSDSGATCCEHTHRYLQSRYISVILLVTMTTHRHLQALIPASLTSPYDE